ncbi:hypothetical protein NC981_22150, partial [Leptolyngbya sp. DQ-M1]|uniref:hypothetical protein n=1 Tax=Leptolyngbya sp. DQ-M1 TaxID=2933920 RepID=UPI003296E002
ARPADEDESVAFEPVVEGIKDAALRWRATYCDGHLKNLQISAESKGKLCDSKMNYEQSLLFVTYASDYMESSWKISSVFVTNLKIQRFLPLAHHRQNREASRFCGYLRY